MMMVLDPVEVFGSTTGGADNFKVDIDNGNELGSLSGSLEVSHDGIPYVSLLGDSLVAKTRSM